MPTGVYPRTEYHRLIRIGWHHSKETKKKMSQSRMGHSGYTKGRRLWPNGRIFSEEWKEKLHKFPKGNIPWNKNKGKYPNGRDPLKAIRRKEKYQKLGLLALYLRNCRAKRKLAEGRINAEEWNNLKKKYSFTCFSCLRSEPEIKLSIDHIVPLSKGGSNFIENIQPLCVECNVKKHTKIIKYQYAKI